MKYNRGLIIRNAFSVFSETTHMIERFIEEFKAFNIELDVKFNNEIVAFIDSDGNVKTKQMPYDFIIYTDKDYYIAKLLETAGYRVFNNAEAIRICDDKMLTHLSLVNNGIKMPKTISFPLQYFTTNKNEFLNHLIKELDYPFIAKMTFGSLGEQVFLIQNEQQLIAFENNAGTKPHMYQEFIATSFGKDMRVVLVNGEVVANMKRIATNQKEFRSNIETGGVGHKEPLPASFAEIAKKVSKLINLDYCGLDILYGDDETPILLEVNAGAFFGPIEKYSGINVALAYVKHIINTIYN